MILRGLRTIRGYFGPPPPHVVFSFRLLGLQGIFIVLIATVGAFDVMPKYFVSVLMFVNVVFFGILGPQMKQVEWKIMREGWAEFLRGREELGEYDDDEDGDR